MGTFRASIAFGGNFYAYVNSKDLEFKLASSNLPQILRVARELLKELREVDVVHPEISSIKGVLGVSLFENTNRLSARNIMIAENDLFDRSPCGTGTCGRMAVLHATGTMSASASEEFTSQSIIGTKFVGKIKEITRVGPYPAILPEITGRAYLTGIADLMVSDEDPLGTGFVVG
jgi:proline racemase